MILIIPMPMIDVFGDYSLFQNLNRTATYIGKKHARLLQLAPNHEIIQNQEGIKELATKIDWRQDFFGLRQSRPR
jgi:hypothetical protein